MGATEPLERAIATAKQVLAGVSKEDLEKSSPCVSWNVGGVVNHLVGSTAFFVTGMGDTMPSGDDGSVDFSSGDYRVAFDEGSALTLATFSAPGALEKTAKLPFGEMPGSAFLGLAATDIFTHAWDLAKATGQSTDLDPELAAQLLQGSKMAIQDAFRGPDGGPNQDQGAPFGPEQQAPEGATNADKLAAFLGRTV
jgi:uncharacterized protein (TIGR03086 family)